MKWSRKIMAAVLAVASLMGMTSLSGCGSSNNAQEENPKSIKIWHYEEDNGAMGKAWKKAMDIFEKETGVKVEFEKKSFEQIRQTASQVLNSDAVRKGVLRDPLTGNVGSIDTAEFMDYIEEVTLNKEDKKLKVVAAGDIYTEGPVKVKLILK